GAVRRPARNLAARDKRIAPAANDAGAKQRSSRVGHSGADAWRSAPGLLARTQLRARSAVATALCAVVWHETDVPQARRYNETIKSTSCRAFFSIEKSSSARVRPASPKRRANAGSTSS